MSIHFNFEIDELKCIINNERMNGDVSRGYIVAPHVTWLQPYVKWKSIHE